MTLDKNYREEENGSDIIFDHIDQRILLFEYKITDDSVCISIVGKQSQDYKMKKEQ